MHEPQVFFVGFAVAGILGFFGTLFNRSWTAVGRARKRVFVDCPKPSLQDASGSSDKNISATPNQSALQEVFGGCFTMIAQLVWQLGLAVLLGALVFWFSEQVDFSLELFSGIVFAAVFTVLITQVRSNWRKITILYSRITNPPVPQLQSAAPPNNHYLAAKPPLPAFTNVVDGFFEIGWRMVLQLILLFLLFEAMTAAYFYISEGVIRFSDMGVFGV